MSYIETIARFGKTMEDGAVKKMRERYICDALTCTEAEAITVEKLRPYVVHGELEVTSNKKVNISEVLGNMGADHFYIAKVAFVSIDDKTGKEKQPITQWLIGGTDFNDAYEMALREMNKTMADTEIVSLSESPVKGVFSTKQ